MSQYKHIVILLAYNDNQAIKDYLTRAVRLSAIDKVIMVDNASTTGLFEDLTSFVAESGLAEKVDCIQTGHNGGYAFGNNVGLRYALSTYQPAYLSVSNADITLNQEALEACMEALKAEGSLALVAPRMVSNRPEEAFWDLPTYWNLVSKNLILWQGLIKRFKSQDALMTVPHRVGVIAGSYYMGRSETFEKLDFLDERTFLYGEENILAFKVNKAGLYNQILPDVTFEHHHSTSINISIQSIGKRLDILKESCHVYLKEYLKIGPLGLAFFDASHWLGKVTYLGARQLRQFIVKN